MRFRGLLLVVLSAVFAALFVWGFDQRLGWASSAMYAGCWLAALVVLVIDRAAWTQLKTWVGYQSRLATSPGETTAQPPATGLLSAEVTDAGERLITLHQRNTAAAQGRLDEFLAAIQVSPNGVTLLTSDARIEWCNQTALQHFGFQLPRDMLQLVGNLLRNPAFNAYLQAQSFDAEVLIDQSGGRQIAVQLHQYGDKRLLMLSRDVTAIEQAAQMRRDFVANVSHEIRTPLTVLNGCVETLRTLDLDAPDRERYLGLMAQQGERMQALVTDLLALSRLENLPNAPMSQSIDVFDLLQKAEHQTQQILGHNGEFTLNWIATEGGAPPAANLRLLAVESEAHSALTNLLTNALRYSDTPCRIRLQCQVTALGELHMAVSDNGQGIAPEHIPRLTERFYRTDVGRSRAAGGTGLGLAIVKHIMQRHEGRLLIDSTPGLGSRFTLVWPARRVVLPASTTNAQV